MKYVLRTALLVLAFSLFNCGGVKVVDAWRSPDVGNARDGHFLIIARTTNETNRIAFEREIADALIARGIKATPSYSKFPPLNPDVEMTEERKAMIKKILEDEGFNSIVVTSLKDVKERTTTSGGYYYNDPWNSFYPGYYGGFYSYFYYPVYSVSVPIVGGEPTTYTTKTFYLETVAFNLDAEEDNQLMAVVTTTIEDPKDAYKTASRYTEEIMKALDQQKKKQ
ncbi:MAG: hypothetical protein AAGH46_06470 [Bacteroidota bacterium]